MPRLGAVLGAVLAEIARARSTADSMTRDLVDLYRDDPVLAGMSVPRTVLGDMTLALKFDIRELEEMPQRPVAPEDLQGRWSRAVRTAAIPDTIRRLGLTAEQALALVYALANREPLPDPPPAVPAEETAKILKRWNPVFKTEELQAAIGKDLQALLDSTRQLYIDAWRYLPPDLRRKFESANELARHFSVNAPKDLTAAIAAEESEQELLAVLRSRLQVNVQGHDIQNMAALQSLTLTFKGADIDTLIEPED
jgi:hypothetical protein